jgi:Domain of unknown function (DUF1918).
MSENTQQVPAQPGDLMVVQGHHLGESSRTGEILEVLGEPGHPHYRVRWEDDHVSLFYRSNDASVRHRAKGGSL